MLPIRLASLRSTTRLVVASLLLLGAGFLRGPVRADRLLPMGVDEFRSLIDGKHDPLPDAVALTNYRRSLRKAVADLPSLAEVSRVLLLSEWTASDLDVDSTIAPERIEQAVRAPDDEAFQRAVQKLLALKPEDRVSVNRAIVAEMKNEVRQKLLDNLEKNTRAYLRDGRGVDRIAASNLISDTITTSHSQDISQYAGVTGVMHSTSRDITQSSRDLRNRLRALIGDVRKLTLEADPQVQVAAIRALSNLEKDGNVLAAALKPLLTSKESNVAARQAAAEALGHMLEVTTMQMDKSRPLPYLKSVEQVLPVAVLGLADDSAEVRFASLMACQRAATVLDDLANDPLAKTERRLMFRSAMAAVDRAQPALNDVARDRVPSLRVLACRVLEAIVLVDQKVRRPEEQSLPDPLSIPEPNAKPSKEGDKRNKGVSLPSQRKVRRLAASGPSLWGVARGQAQAETRPIPAPASLDLDETPTVGLQGPIQLTERPPVAAELKPVAFQARAAVDLPLPKPVTPGVGGVIATMIDNLSDPDYRVRLSAVEVLETMGERAESAIPAVVKSLSDSNKFVRWSAVRMLGRMSPQRANEVVPGLTRLLNDREDPSVRLAVAYALELYGPAAKQAVPHLARVINRGDKDYVLAILHTIQGIGTDAVAALPNVAWILTDRDQATSVRVEAALTLGRFGALAQKQLPTLREIMVHDPDEAVRNAASTAVLGVDRPLQMTK